MKLYLGSVSTLFEPVRRWTINRPGWSCATALSSEICTPRAVASFAIAIFSVAAVLAVLATAFTGTRLI